MWTRLNLVRAESAQPWFGPSGIDLGQVDLTRSNLGSQSWLDYDSTRPCMSLTECYLTWV